MVTVFGGRTLSLKKNQQTTFEQVSAYMQANQSLLQSDKGVDFGSGRIETRTCYVLKDLTFLPDFDTL